MRFSQTLQITALAVLLCTFLLALPTDASSHREAPFITEMPKVDGTDFYMFRSYEEGRSGFVTLVTNYIPLQDPFGGPNYFAMDPNAFYQIQIENDGQPGPDVVFTFRFTNRIKGIEIPVGDESVAVPLVNVGEIDRSGAASNFGTVYTLRMQKRGMSAVDPLEPFVGEVATNLSTGGSFFAKPQDNVGRKSIPDYDAYARSFVTDFSIDGCGEGRVFVGQRKESFAVNLGETFDLVNIANPIGARDVEPSSTAGKNITSLALEVPTDCLTADTNVIGGWTTALVRTNRTLEVLYGPSGAASASRATEATGGLGVSHKGHVTFSGGVAQVSRLAMPLVNEVVIGLPDKDLFNGSRPQDDAQFATYVTHPTLPELLEILFGGAGVRAPNNFPRQDPLAAFVTGIPGLNQLGFGEMLRLNTGIAPTPKAQQNNLGVLGGDNAGFPNGRRPGDDVVDAELRVAMGVLCHAFPGAFGCGPADAPSGDLPFTDGTLQDASQFDAAFPYLTTPIPGSPNGENGLPAAAD